VVGASGASVVEVAFGAGFVSGGATLPLPAFGTVTVAIGVVSVVVPTVGVVVVGVVVVVVVPVVVVAVVVVVVVVVVGSGAHDAGSSATV